MTITEFIDMLTEYEEVEGNIEVCLYDDLNKFPILIEDVSPEVHYSSDKNKVTLYLNFNQ